MIEGCPTSGNLCPLVLRFRELEESLPTNDKNLFNILSNLVGCIIERGNCLGIQIDTNETYDTHQDPTSYAWCGNENISAINQIVENAGRALGWEEDKILTMHEIHQAQE
jgi:hypothetical protein